MSTIPMGSHEAIEGWAKSNFPEDFARVASFTNIHIKRVTFDGTYGSDGEVESKPIVLTAIECGEHINGEVVYAYIAENGSVKLCCKAGDNIMTENDMAGQNLRYMMQILGRTHIKFHEPFFWPRKAGAKGWICRVGSLFRYFFRRGGEQVAQPTLDFFTTHFPAACREVAQGLTDEGRYEEMNGNETIPEDTVSALVSDTDTATADNESGTSPAFHDHVHTMDEGYHEFRTKILTKLEAAQTVERKENQELKRKLVVNEAELDVQVKKTKTAAEEAANWKAQYENLKGILQGALDQHLS